jgi:asparagine synthase (glutamine-hydrolysing)
MLTLSARDTAPTSTEYWSPQHAATIGISDPFNGSEADAVKALDAVLRQAVHGQMAADVPLGAFLSGGIDSSVVVSLMQAQSTDSIKTFTIGFTEKNYDEAPHATAVVPRIGAIYDEPFADPSQIPTVLLAQLARQHVTVSLSGDGGDELFCGYTRYATTKKLWRWLSVLPQGGRQRLSSHIAKSAFGGIEALARLLQKTVYRQLNVYDRVQKGAALLEATSIDDLYYLMTSHLPDPAHLVLGLSPEDRSFGKGTLDPSPELHPIERMMLLDIQRYLPDDILVKVDRASMSVGLESRVPLLDRQVVEFAWSLPLSLKSKNGHSKWVLKELLGQYLPKNLIERPKKGFGVPLDAWLRGPLREWADALLDENRLTREGYFDAQALRQKWNEHISCKRNWSYHLWSALMFQSWLEHNVSNMGAIKR